MPSAAATGARSSAPTRIDRSGRAADDPPSGRDGHCLKSPRRPDLSYKGPGAAIVSVPECQLTRPRIPTLMLSRNALTRRSFAVLAASGVLVIDLVGGTDDGLGKRFPVSGTVTYNGKPLEKGTISFVPDDPKGVGATGAIENGSYTLSTGGNSDGARAGKYKVTITAKEDSPAKAKADFEKARAALSKRPGLKTLATYRGNS